MTRHDIAEALDGIPPAKLHSAVLVIDALKAALDGAEAGGQLTSGAPPPMPAANAKPGPRIHRRIFHVVTTAAVALMALGLEREVMIIITASLTGATVALEVARRRFAWLNEWFMSQTSALLKESEVESGAGEHLHGGGEPHRLPVFR